MKHRVGYMRFTEHHLSCINGNGYCISKHLYTLFPSSNPFSTIIIHSDFRVFFLLNGSCHRMVTNAMQKIRTFFMVCNCLEKYRVLTNNNNNCVELRHSLKFLTILK